MTNVTKGMPLPAGNPLQDVECAFPSRIPCGSSTGPTRRNGGRARQHVPVDDVIDAQAGPITGRNAGRIRVVPADSGGDRLRCVRSGQRVMGLGWRAAHADDFVAVPRQIQVGARRQISRHSQPVATTAHRYRSPGVEKLAHRAMPCRSGRPHSNERRRKNPSQFHARLSCASDAR